MSNKQIYSDEPCDTPLCSCQYDIRKGFICDAPHLIKKKKYTILWNRQLPDFKIVGYSIWKNGEMVAINHGNTLTKLI